MSPRQLVKRTFAPRWQPPRVSSRPSADPKPTVTVSLKEIGSRFKDARKALKLTQDYFTTRIGVDQGNFSSFESGKRGFQSDTMLALLAVAAEAGMNVDGYVLRGVGGPVRRETLLVATTPELAEGLRELAARVDKARNSPSEPPGPRHKR